MATITRAPEEDEPGWNWRTMGNRRRGPSRTPAARAKARRDPAVALPPKPPEGDRRSGLLNLHVRIQGVAYLIGPSIEGDPAMTATIDGTGTVTIAVRDTSGALLEALGTEAQLLKVGVLVVINRITYVLQSVSVDSETGTLVTMVFEDEVSWRLKRFSRFRTFSRGRYTRARAVLELVKEASAKPLAPMKAFIPELTDKQRIAAAEPDDEESTKKSTKKGAGAATTYKVKGRRATAAQRSAIDKALGEADRLGASRRVMIALVMAGTQESLWTRAGRTGNDDVSYLQQGRNWISVANASDAAKAARAFLLGHEANVGGTDRVQGWKQRHGSLKNAPGDLNAAITAVQISVGGYGPWEAESTSTVDAWTGGGSGGGGAGDGGRTIAEPYEFSRGSKDGEREDSWAATGRWGEEVAFRRWAEANTLAYVSDDELRAAAPALEVHGDEPWLLAPPGMDWSPDRPVSETTIRVLAERWGVLIGASVILMTGPLKGRFIVAATDGFMVNPELTVTLRRPAAKKPEPPHTTREASSSGDGAGAGTDGKSSDLLDIMKTIDKQDRAYVYGGGHGPALSKIGPGDGLDCSSSCSLALYRAKMFNGTTAIVSGGFASSWGKPGKGKTFTVWANAGHVWIELHDAGQYKRFDTSGPGERGPHLRTTARSDQARFTARHWPGA